MATPTDELAIVPAATGNTTRDYSDIGAALGLIHTGSVHTCTFVMNRTTGELVLRRHDKEVYRGDIMDLSILAQPTPALRFTELCALLTT